MFGPPDLPPFGLAGFAQELSSVEAGDTGNGGYHHARKQLHGGDVFLVKSTRRGGEYLENAQGAAVMAQRRDQDRADAQAFAAGKVNPRIALGVMAKHDFAGSDGLGGDAGIGLEADAKVGSSAAGTGATDDLISGA